MLKSFVKCSLVAAAVAAALGSGGAHAQSYVTADGSLIRTGDGQCWRTGYWTADTASEACESQPLPAATTEMLLSAEILFAFNDDRMSGDALKRLDGLAQKMVAMDIEKVTAVAHADSLGSSDYNQLLSARRLWAVRDYFAAKGVAEEQFLLEAKGDRDRVSPTACDALGVQNGSKAKRIACLQADRRVKVEVIGRQKRID
jgi:OOP family OmpA-OmpF porin